MPKCGPLKGFDLNLVTRYFALALNTPNSNTKTAPARRPNAAFRPKNPGVWLMSLLFVLGVSYLLQVNSISTKGYEIKKLEQRLLELKEINDRLEIETRSLQAIETIEAQTRTLNLVPASNVNHVLMDSNFSYQR